MNASFSGVSGGTDHGAETRARVSRESHPTGTDGDTLNFCLTCSSDRTLALLHAVLQIPSVFSFAALFSVVRWMSFCAGLGTAMPQLI